MSKSNDPDVQFMKAFGAVMTALIMFGCLWIKFFGTVPW